MIHNLPLIIIDEKKAHPDIFNLFFANPRQIKDFMKNPAKRVLQIMLKEGLTLMPDRKAVWRYQHIKNVTTGKLLTAFREKIGTTFAQTPQDFGKKCYGFCKEKVQRTIASELEICSHESRDPANNKWGGSIKLKFLAVSISGDENLIASTSSSSGLKEWEDAVNELAIWRYLGVISFKHQQVQEILARIDESVKNYPDSHPHGITITEYAKMVFDAIG